MRSVFPTTVSGRRTVHTNWPIECGARWRRMDGRLDHRTAHRAAVGRRRPAGAPGRHPPGALCRAVAAFPEDRGAALWQPGRLLRIATKYPRLTARYFDEQERPVEIVVL